MYFRSKVEAVFGADVRSFTRGAALVRRQLGRLTSASGTMRRHISRNMKLAAAATTGLATVAVREFARIQRGVSEIATINDDVAKSMGRWQRQIMDMARELPGVDAVDSARAMYQALSSGVQDVNDAFEMTRVAGMTSIAGITSVETAMSAVTAAMNAYHMETRQATHISDVLFQTVKEGRLRFEDLVDPIGRVAPAAAAAGVDLENLAAALAATTLSGLSAREAGTALRSMILGILSPTDDARELFAEMGMVTGRAAFAGRSLADVMTELAQRSQGNVDVLAELFPNVRALIGALTLGSEGGARFAKILDRIQHSAGAMTRAFGIVARDVKSRWDAAIESMRQSLATLGEVLAPFAIKVFDAFAGQMKRLITWLRGPGGRYVIDFLTEVRVLLAKLVAVLTGLGKWLLYFADRMAIVRRRGGDWKDFLMAIAQSMGELPVFVENAMLRVHNVIERRLRAEGEVFKRAWSRLNLEVLAGGIAERYVRTFTQIGEGVGRALDAGFRRSWIGKILLGAGPAGGAGLREAALAEQAGLKQFGEFVKGPLAEALDKVAPKFQDLAGEIKAVNERLADLRRQQRDFATEMLAGRQDFLIRRMERMGAPAAMTKLMEYQLAGRLYGMAKKAPTPEEQLAGMRGVMGRLQRLAAEVPVGGRAEQMVVRRLNEVAAKARAVMAQQQKEAEQQAENLRVRLNRVRDELQGILRRAWEIGDAPGMIKLAATSVTAKERIQEMNAELQRTVELLNKAAAGMNIPELFFGAVPGAQVGFQHGGFVGYDTPSLRHPGLDSILARLTPGEFVVRREAVAAYRPELEAMNRGEAPGPRGDVHMHFSQPVTRELIRNVVVPEIRRAGAAGVG